MMGINKARKVFLSEYQCFLTLTNKHVVPGNMKPILLKNTLIRILLPFAASLIPDSRYK